MAQRRNVSNSRSTWFRGYLRRKHWGKNGKILFTGVSDQIKNYHAKWLYYNWGMVSIFLIFYSEREQLSQKLVSYSISSLLSGTVKTVSTNAQYVPKVRGNIKCVELCVLKILRDRSYWACSLLIAILALLDEEKMEFSEFGVLYARLCCPGSGLGAKHLDKLFVVP